MRSRPVLAAGLAVLTLPLLASCGDLAERDFCTQYDELVSASQEWQEQDPLTANADDLRAAANDFRAELDQFQAVSEGRLDSQISTLRAELDAVRQAAIEADDEALQTARQLIEDAVDNANEAWAVVQDRAAAECPQDN